MTAAHARTFPERLKQLNPADVAIWLVGAALLFTGCVLIHSWTVLLVGVGISLMNGTYHFGDRS